MKFQPDALAGVNVVSRFEAGRLWVLQESHSRSLLLPWRGQAREWTPQRQADLRPEHFAELDALDPEVVIFGSGPQFAILNPGLYKGLIVRQIGVESMDTAAACRTLSVLAQEGRRVVGAFLLAS